MTKNEISKANSNFSKETQFSNSPVFFKKKKIKNFLDEKECDNFIKHFDSIKNKNIFTDEKVESHEEERYDIYLNKKLKNHILNLEFDENDHKKICRFIKYKKGDIFRVHKDEPFGPTKKGSHRLLIYLNDCNGGHTSFPLYNVSVEPTKGTAIIFPIDLLHKSTKLLSDYKYVIAYDLLLNSSNLNSRSLNIIDEKILSKSDYYENVYNNEDILYYIIETDKEKINNKLKYKNDNFFIFDVCMFSNKIGTLICDVLYLFERNENEKPIIKTGFYGPYFKGNEGEKKSSRLSYL